MNSGLKEIVEEIQTESRTPPQEKSSKAQIKAIFHKIPMIRSVHQQLTSFLVCLFFDFYSNKSNWNNTEKMIFAFEKIANLRPTPYGLC